MKSARQLVDALRIEQPPNKSLGQHFLIDDDILERIITHANLNESDHVLEIEQPWNIDSSIDAKIVARSLQLNSMKELANTLIMSLRARLMKAN